MKKFGIIALAGLLVFCAVAYIVYDNYDIFQGARIKDPDCYILEFTAMNRQDSHVITRKAGETITVSYIITSGKADLTVGAAGQENLYTGNGLTEGEFVLTANEDGDYVITVNAKHAAGVIKIYAPIAETNK